MLVAHKCDNIITYLFMANLTIITFNSILCILYSESMTRIDKTVLLSTIYHQNWDLTLVVSSVLKLISDYFIKNPQKITHQMH